MTHAALASDATHALTLAGITCRFAGATPAVRPYTAVKDASLFLERGEFVAIVGPTGCGKSTILNVAAGLLAASAGEVAVFGARLAGLNRHAGYMFQAECLLPWLDARANVAFGLELRGVARREAAERAQAWLERVGLGGHGHAYPYQLSGGMKKRVALAQVLVLEPPILLMDEPFSALDVQTRQLMENELLEIWSADKKSVLFVTHDLEEAISLADRVVVFSAGPETRPVAEFAIDIPRPRDVTEIVQSPHFLGLHRRIWDTLKTEVLESYRRAKATGA
ncbi:MAG TPA: ABC transporter ATP-binding protein [Alphaproteobacteria bacterium]|nr:ABC transporter ATP-binding protein [Alphaproteobacteria bacterium]